MGPSCRSQDTRHPLGWAVVGLFVVACGVLSGLVLGQRLVIVSGVSMLPTAETGDLVVIWPATDYDVGDAVVYRVPDGASGEGTRVYHRIVDHIGDRLVFQGDNNSSPDPWRLGSDAIVGRELLRVPNVGWALHYAGQPAIIAAIAAGIAAALATSRVLDDDGCGGTHCDACGQA